MSLLPPSPSVLAAALRGLLTLVRLPLLELFVLPGDPLPKAITRLTGLTQADVDRVLNTITLASLEQALLTKPTELYYVVLASCLCYHTPLGRATLARHGGAAVWEESAELLEPLTPPLLVLLAHYLPQPAAVATTEAELREAFARHYYELPHNLPPPVAPTPNPAPDTDDGIWLTMTPGDSEQNLFALALNLTVMARLGVPHPLGKGLATVPALGSDQQLQQLAQRLREAAPDTEQALNRPDLLRLYLSLHVLALLCVADLQPALMARLEPEAGAPAPWHDPEQQQHFVAWVGSQVEALSQIFDGYFADEPAYQAAQAEVQRLAQLV